MNLQIKKLIDTKQYKEAKLLGIQMLSESPDNEDIKIGLIRTYIMLNEYENAMLLIKDMQLKDINNPNPYFYEAIISNFQGNFKNSILLLKIALNKGYDSYMVFKNMSIVYGNMNNHKKAFSFLEKIAEHYPNDLYSRERMVDIARQQGQFGKALTILDEIIFNFPTNEKAHELKGKILSAVGKKEDAISFCNRSLKTFPNNVVLNCILIEYLSQNNNHKGAIDEIDKLISKNENIDYLILKGEILSDTDNYEQAHSCFLHAYSTSENYKRQKIGYYLMLIEYGNKNFVSAKKYAEDIIKVSALNPFYTSAMMILPACSEMLKEPDYKDKYKAMIKYYDEEFNGDIREVFIYKALAYAKIGDLDKVDEIIEDIEVNYDLNDVIALLRYIIAKTCEDTTKTQEYKNIVLEKYPNYKELIDIMEVNS